MGGAATKFSLENVQSQDGKVVIVTGGNAGIGFGTVKGLATKGATVIIASRNQERVHEAILDVKKLHPGAKVEGMVVDLLSFSSIDKFVAEVKCRYSKVDVLVNNAGLGMIPFAKTEQGFEPTLGANVMGTAYLTISLLPLIAAASAGRVVFLGALPVNLVNQKEVEKYITDVGGQTLTKCTFETYRASKLFTCLFALEFQKRLTAHNNAAYKKIVCLVADPGVVKTTFHGKMKDSMFKSVMGVAERILGTDVETGSLSSIYCATSLTIPEGMKGGTFQAGPYVAPFKWDTKAYNAENGVRVFEAVNALIAVKGAKAFE